MRRPARLERAGALTPRDRIWAAMRGFGVNNAFSIAEIMLLSGQSDNTAFPYVKGLALAGYLVQDAPRPLDRPRRELQWYRLVRDIGAEAPRVDAGGQAVTQGRGRDQMWRAMKATREFDYRALALAASTEQHVVSVREAKAYCLSLKAAGYLQVVTPATRGAHPTPERLRFVRTRDTGPRAPLITRERQVMDTNTGAIVYDPKEPK